MAGRYIPPHMRGSTGSSSAQQPSAKAERKPEDGYTLDEIANQYSFDHKKQLGTLNRVSLSIEEEEKFTLGFVIVFEGQHPRWPPKVFSKTNLFLLPKTDTLPSMYISCDDRSYTNPDMSHKVTRSCPPFRNQISLTLRNSCPINRVCYRRKDADSELGAPVAVFTEISKARTPENHKHHEQRFLFAGAHTITRIQYLMPRTSLLIKMLESKFTGPKNERSEEAWNKSLNMKWAVVDLNKVEGEEQGNNPMEPLKEIKKKGVSEMLEEMRLREGNGSKENVKSGGGDDREEVLNGDEH